MDEHIWERMLLPYEQAVDELIIKFRNLDASYRRLGMTSPIEQVEGRVKRLSSIFEKANRKNIPPEQIESQMDDIAGVRIICRFVEDIEKVLDMVRKRDGVDLRIIKERDYIKNIKPSGYRSYHIIVAYPVISATGYKSVNCEIQIRTLAMNFWATIEHSLKYKYQGKLPEQLHKRLISCAEAAARLDFEMSAIRGELNDAKNENEIRDGIVDKILERLQMLYDCADFKRASELNGQFLSLYEKGDIAGLNSLCHQLEVMTEIYEM